MRLWVEATRKALMPSTLVTGTEHGDGPIGVSLAYCYLTASREELATSNGALLDPERDLTFPRNADCSRLTLSQICTSVPEVLGFSVCNDYETADEAQWVIAAPTWNACLSTDPVEVRPHMAALFANVCGAHWSDDEPRPQFACNPQPLVDRGMLGPSTAHLLEGRATRRPVGLVRSRVQFFEGQS